MTPKWRFRLGVFTVGFAVQCPLQLLLLRPGEAWWSILPYALVGGVGAVLWFTLLETLDV